MTGSGLSALVTDRSASRPTLLIRLKVLLVVVASVSLMAMMAAVLVAVEPSAVLAGTLTAMATVAVASTARLPIVQVTSWPLTEQPPSLLT